MRLGVTFIASLLALSGCKDEKTRACQTQLASAEDVVKAGASSAADLDKSLDAVERALTLCRAAGRTSETSELERAKRELAAQREVLAERATRKKRLKPSAADTAELIKHGDTSCPRGMAYKAEGSDKQIRCTGPEPVRMSALKARDYYKSLGFHVTTSDAPPTLRAEFGAELLVFSYAKPDDPAPPICLSYYPTSDMPWQEAVARLTGAQLPRIRKDQPVPLPDGGEVALRVEEGSDKLIVHLGNCPVDAKAPQEPTG